MQGKTGERLLNMFPILFRRLGFILICAVFGYVFTGFPYPFDKLEFDNPTGAVSNFWSLRASAHTGVAISIFFLTTYRHPFVGAVIDRPCKCIEFQHKFTSNGTFSPKEMQISYIFLPGAH